MLHLVRAADTRRTETPNATMTTLASPTLGASAGPSLWRVEMAAGATGPWHVFDVEQIWTVLAGTIEVESAGTVAELGPGDTMVLAAGDERQIRARTDCTLIVTGSGQGVASVPGETSTRGTPAWIV